MEFIWRKNVGMKIAIAPRSLLVAASVVLAIYAPDYLPMRIPMMPDGYSDAKPDRHSNLMPDTVPI